jgi:hypothetical protein
MESLETTVKSRKPSRSPSFSRMDSKSADGNFVADERPVATGTGGRAAQTRPGESQKDGGTQRDGPKQRMPAHTSPEYERQSTASIKQQFRTKPGPLRVFHIITILPTATRALPAMWIYDRIQPDSFLIEKRSERAGGRVPQEEGWGVPVVCFMSRRNYERRGRHWSKFFWQKG